MEGEGVSLFMDRPQINFSATIAEPPRDARRPVREGQGPQLGDEEEVPGVWAGAAGRRRAEGENPFH